MARLDRLAACCIGALTPLLAYACGPDFISILTHRPATLAAPLSAMPPHTLLPPPSQTAPAHPTLPDTPRQQIEAQALNALQAAQLTRMRLASDGNAAYAIAWALPHAVRLYAAAAVDFHRAGPATAGRGLLTRGQGHALRQAQLRWRAILALPPAAAASRAVWAAFMLGREQALRKRPRSASRYFRLTRHLARHGAPDPLALALASLGEQGRIAARARRYAQAVRFYAEQEAQGEASATDSLSYLAGVLLTLPAAQLKPWLSDPLILQLLVRHALLLSADALQSNPQAMPLLRKLAPLLPAHPPQTVGLDQLAAVAYNGGNFALAAQLLRQQNSGLAHWVQARLALYHGQTARALREYASALSALQHPESSARARAEAAVLWLERGAFEQALARLLEAGPRYWIDAAYLADRVLSVGELQSFVDSHPGMPHRLRLLLARRLMRVGNYGAALAYFPAALRARDQQLIQTLNAAQRAWSANTRARALYAAAQLLRQHGLELMGTELDPDDAYSAGNYTIANPLDPGARAEARRFRLSAPQPDLRWHYRSVAAALAERAADTQAPRSQAFAALLCQAGAWATQTDGPRARSIYRRYLRQGPYQSWAVHFAVSCPAPRFESRFQRWWHAHGQSIGLHPLWRRARRGLQNHPRLALLAMAALWLAARGLRRT